MNSFERVILILFAIVLPCSVMAQDNTAESLLENAISVIKSDAGVRMNFSFVLYDMSGEKQYDGDGTFKIDGKKYSLITEEMKLWCDGNTQWSYIKQNNEIYVSEPNAEDARTFSPVHLMELYKEGFDCVKDKSLSTDKINVVTLKPIVRGREFEKVTISLDKRTNQPVKLVVYYDNDTSMRITISSYKGKCKFSTKDFRCREKDYPGVEFVDMR